MRIAEAIGRCGGKRQARLARQLQKSFRIVEIHCQWFFGIDMFSGAKGCVRNRKMAFRRGQVDDDLNVRVCQQGFVTFIGWHVIMRHKCFQALRRTIINTTQAKLRIIAQRGHVIIGDEPRADNRDVHEVTPIRQIASG